MIEARNLSFSYKDGPLALDDINLKIEDGQFIALLGVNGCGKTTLLKHLNGLLKPGKGEVLLDGRRLSSLSQEEVFQQVGMVFQDPNDQLFAINVEQDVAFGAFNLGLEAAEVSRRTAEALQMVGATGLELRPIHTLSYGQKRRVAIAGVLAMRPGVILLDEPTGGLDPCGISAIMRLLRSLNKQGNISMVMATHDVDLVPLFCDRIIVMSRGRILGQDTPRELFTNIELIRAANLRLPRITHLAEILMKEDGIRLEKLPLTIGQARKQLKELMRDGCRQK